jgi:hypothetical protein
MMARGYLANHLKVDLSCIYFLFHAAFSNTSMMEDQESVNNCKIRETYDVNVFPNNN